VRRRILAAAAALVLLVVGSLVLVAYANGADRRALAGVQTVPVLVVTRAIPAGTAADQVSGMVGTQLVPAKTAVAGRVTDLAALAGKVTTVELEAGEQLLASRFADPAELRPAGTVAVPVGEQEVTVSLDRERAVGGRLTAGDTVGVLLSLKLPDGTEQTHAVLHGVLVTQVVGGTAPATGTSGAQGATGGGAASGSSTGDGAKVMVTLAVSAADAETVVFGAEHGSLWLTAEPGGAATGGTRVLTPTTVYGEASS
jgi:pilus assembly protein CpaB